MITVAEILKYCESQRHPPDTILAQCCCGTCKVANLIRCAQKDPAGDPLPPDLVETVLRLDAEATPGPWTPSTDEPSDVVIWGPQEDWFANVGNWARHNGPDIPAEAVARQAVEVRDIADARLIATYRTAAPTLARAIQAATGVEAAGFLHHAVYSFLRRPKGPGEEKVSPEEATACAEYVARIWGEHVAACVKERP